MSQNFVAKATTIINASVSRVWEALTDPNLIKQYLFGTEAETTWQVGSPIIWRGQWQGRTYEDKGTVLTYEPEKLLETTYWSSMSGLLDIPNNYKKVIYELVADGEKTKLTIIQDNNATEEERSHSEQNWNMVLKGLKKVVERGKN